MEEVETETTQEMTRKQERFEEEKRELKRGLKIKEQGRMIGAKLTSQAIVIGARQEWKLKNILNNKLKNKERQPRIKYDNVERAGKKGEKGRFREKKCKVYREYGAHTQLLGNLKEFLLNYIILLIDRQ